MRNFYFFCSLAMENGQILAASATPDSVAINTAYGTTRVPYVEAPDAMVDDAQKTTQEAMPAWLMQEASEDSGIYDGIKIDGFKTGSKHSMRGGVKQWK